MPLAELEKREILRAIEYTRGDRTIAAALLGIGRTTLYRKLKEYGFDDGTSTALANLSEAIGYQTPVAVSSPCTAPEPAEEI